MLWSPQNIKFILNLDYLPNFQNECTGISTDTRNIKNGDLFIALKGQNFDGNNFIESAVTSGASCIIANKSNKIFDKNTLNYTIFVDDTYKSLVDIAKFARQRSNAKIIGITGSVGKTTMKEMLIYVMKNLNIKCYGSKKSYNNHIGLPISLIEMPLDTDIGVFEIGTNNPGEISFLSSILIPDISVITKIGPAHIGNFDNIYEIIKEKCCIFNYTKDFSILNTDYFIRDYCDENEVKKINEYEENLDKNGVILINKDIKFQQTGNFTKDTGEFILNILTNKINENLAISKLDKIKYFISKNNNFLENLVLIIVLFLRNIDFNMVIDILTKFNSVDGRGNVYKLKIHENNIKLIDESYNANPISMLSGIDKLMNYSKRKIAVMGDMKELGSYSLKFHINIVNYALQNDIKILCIGDYFNKCKNSMYHDNDNILYFENTELLFKYLVEIIQDEDAIMIKASRSMRFDKIVDDLLKISDH